MASAIYGAACSEVVGSKEFERMIDSWASSKGCQWTVKIVTAVLSYCIISNFVPLYNSLPLVSTVPYFGDFIYYFCDLFENNLGVDFREAKHYKCVVGLFCCVFGFLFVSFITTVLDLFPSVFLKFKTQGNRSRFTVSEWLEAFSLSMFNLLVVSWTCIPLVQWLVVFLHGENVALESDPWVPKVEIFKFLCCVVLVDVWFYVTHIFLHVKGVYKAIHKLHHRFKAPTAVAALYAHPVEYAIGNLGGVAIGVAVTNCHPYTGYFWFCFSLMATSLAHSGYVFFGAENHDFHHQFFNYNFGVGGNMDTLCGTNFVGSKQWKTWRAQQKSKKVK